MKIDWEEKEEVKNDVDCIEHPRNACEYANCFEYYLWNFSFQNKAQIVKDIQDKAKS